MSSSGPAPARSVDPSVNWSAGLCAQLRKTRHRGTRRVGWVFTFTLAVYDLVRMRTLIAVQA